MTVPWDEDDILVIANPKAGRLQSKQRHYQASLPPHACWVTTAHPGHAEELALEASARGCGTVIVAGGDGTIHEALNGLMRNPDNLCGLGILPVGTANDYAYSLRAQPHDSARFSRLCDVGLATWVSDSGSTGSRYFANVAGIGLPGRVAHFARQMKRMPARIRYTLALMRCMGPVFQSLRSEIILPNAPTRESVDLLMLSAAIGIREGSYPLTPNARIDDGLLDILRVSMLRRVDVVRYFPRILRGDIPKNDTRISEFRVEGMSIASDSPIPFHLDGEAPNDPSAATAKSLTISVLHRRLRVELMH
jgi:diacylglycerol kinase family enzyme